jgi:beta-lactamase class D
MIKILIFIVLMVTVVLADKNWTSDKDPNKWLKYSKKRLNESLNRRVNNKKAKNIVLFIGDGNRRHLPSNFTF